MQSIKNSYVMSHLSLSGDRNRWTWLSKIQITDEFLNWTEIIPELPILEFWHFRGSKESWQIITKSVKCATSVIQKLILNDVIISSDNVENVVECCVNTR